MRREGSPGITNESILSDFEKSLSLDPDDVYTLNERARFYLSINKPVLAILDIDRAHELDDKAPEIYHTYFLYYQQIGDEAKAAEYRALADEHGYIPDP